MADWKAWAVGGFVVLSLWGSGAAGKALVGTAAVAGTASAANGAVAGGGAAAGAAAASRLAGRQPQGQHFPKPTTTTTAPAPEAGASSVCSGSGGMLTACPVPGANASRSVVGQGGSAPCDITAEPRERVLPQDNDGDGQPDRVTLPELGCK